MSKRILSFLMAGLLALTLAGCGGSKSETAAAPTKSAAPSAAKPASSGPIELTIGHVLKTSDGYQVAAEKFKQVVESKTNGQIKVNIVPEGKLGPEKDMLSKVQSGEMDGAIITSGSFAIYESKFLILDTPFLIKDLNHAHRILDGEIGKALNDGLVKAGFEPIGILDFGFRHLTNSKKAVKTPEDAKDLLVRVLPNGIYQTTWEALTNKAPIVLNFTELPAALKAGKVDGQENPISLLVSYKMWETQKYATKTGHVFAAAPFVMNPSKLKSLTPEQQQIIREAGREAVKVSREFLAEAESKGWQTLKDNGMTVVEEIDTDAFRKAVWDKVMPKLQDQFPPEWIDMALHA
jgi:tripartite ATP-independent transporter DctP family solute receptor